MSIQSGQTFYSFATTYWSTVYGTCNFNPKDFYALDNIPSDKLINAKTTYARYDDTKEHVILHTNKSFLFTRRGILLTSENLYGKLYDGEFKYSLSSIVDLFVEIDKNGFGELNINGKKLGTITHDAKASFLLNHFFNKAMVQDYSINKETILLLIAPQNGDSFLAAIKSLGINDATLYQLASNQIEGETIIKNIVSAHTVLTEHRLINYYGVGKIFRYDKIAKIKFKLNLPHAHAPHHSNLLLKAGVFVANQVQKQEALKNKKFEIVIRDKDYDEFSEYNVSLDDAKELKEFLSAKGIFCDYRFKDFWD